MVAKRLFIIMTFSLVACAAQKPAPQTTVLPEGEWTLLSMHGEAVSGLKKPITLIITSATNRVNGYAGCNQYFSSFTIEGVSLKFTSPGSTKMFCKETMNLEDKYLTALSAVNSFKTESNTLQLLEGDIVLLEFEK
jgi:heat shock protein HslJ